MLTICNIRLSGNAIKTGLGLDEISLVPSYFAGLSVAKDKRLAAGG